MRRLMRWSKQGGWNAEGADLSKSKTKKNGVVRLLRNKEGMEMVQVAILVAIAVALGIIFKTQITSFVNDVFSKLDSSQF